MKVIDTIIRLFTTDNQKALDRRRKRREFKAAAKVQYDMPSFRSSAFDERNELDIYVIAFNDAKLIEYQIKALKHFLVPNFSHIVVDNSNKKEVSEQILSVCKKNDVSYFKVFKPKKIRGTYSASHAMAMNWTYENIIKKRARNFATLDHDIFPAKKIDAAEYVRNREMFGPVRPAFDGVWFIWPGFAFFNWNYVKDKKLDFGRLANFFGKHISDSGGANWKAIYKNYDKSKIPEIKYELYNLLKNEFLPAETHFIANDNQLEQCVEFLYNRSWLHFGGASGWHEIGDKNDYAFKLLDDILSCGAGDFASAKFLPCGTGHLLLK